MNLLDDIPVSSNISDTLCDFTEEKHVYAILFVRDFCARGIATFDTDKPALGEKFPSDPRYVTGPEVSTILPESV